MTAITLYAQPYNIDAHGFYFTSTQEYEEKSRDLRSRFGDPVEEFEIQFIDGDALDAGLFKALDIHQGSTAAFFERVSKWEEWEKISIIIACGECGYTFDIDADDPDQFDITVYEVESLRELAAQFVEDGLFGDIPDRLEPYLDMDAIAADLRFDYTETTIAGKHIVYRAD